MTGKDFKTMFSYALQSCIYTLINLCDYLFWSYANMLWSRNILHYQLLSNKVVLLNIFVNIFYVFFDE